MSNLLLTGSIHFTQYDLSLNGINKKMIDSYDPNGVMGLHVSLQDFIRLIHYASRWDQQTNWDRIEGRHPTLPNSFLQDGWEQFVLGDKAKIYNDYTYLEGDGYGGYAFMREVLPADPFEDTTYQFVLINSGTRSGLGGEGWQNANGTLNLDWFINLQSNTPPSGSKSPNGCSNGIVSGACYQPNRSPTSRSLARS